MAQKITAVIPAYNRPGLLREAIASACAQAGGAFDEIVVTDDLGSEETPCVVAKAVIDFTAQAASNKNLLFASTSGPRIKYRPNPIRLGGVASWNRGMDLAQSEWITVLHEDDLLLPNFLRLVQPQLRPGVAAVAVRCLQGASIAEAKSHRSTGRVREYPSQHFLKSAMTPFPGVVLARDCVRELGGFDPAWGPLADYEFWYRVSGYGKIVFIDVPAAFYRVSESQWTSQAWPEMLRRTLQLRQRIAREQFPRHPRWGKWVARFFTLRNARSYFERFGIETSTDGGANPSVSVNQDPRIASLVRRFQRLRAMPLSRLPSGWVWAAVRLMTLWEQRSSPSASQPKPVAKIGLNHRRHA